MIPDTLLIDVGSFTLLSDHVANYRDTENDLQETIEVWAEKKTV